MKICQYYFNNIIFFSSLDITISQKLWFLQDSSFELSFSFGQKLQPLQTFWCELSFSSVLD